MSDLIVNVRQIGNYPEVSLPLGSDLILVQRGGLGGPYMTVSAADLVAQVLAPLGPFEVGRGAPPADADQAQIFTGNIVLGQGASGAILFNAYVNQLGIVPWTAGAYGLFNQDPEGFEWLVGSGPTPGQPGSLVGVMELSNAGALTLNNGTLTVARDPAYAMEVATLNWVSNNTVGSFNNRRGQVTLNAQDVYSALKLCDPIATQPWVQQAITAGLQTLLAACPFVNTWNGRSGSVYMTLADITCVFFQPGQQPISPTPPITSNDNSIATTQWVVEYISNEFAGGGGTLATQTWVLANTVNSFNGRQGVVNLTLTDVTDVGAAPVNSPNFSGIPTAPTANVGQATGQIATTAFVQQAISANTAGVSTFNTRTGDVVLTSADIVAAGGLANPSAGLTGNPTAPTQAPGTNLPVIATCEFVQAALAGTVTTFNTRSGAVTLQLADITGAGGAPLVSPNFSSVPTAPTAAPGTSTVQLATTAFVTQAVTAAGGVSSFNSRTGAVTLMANDISAAGGLANPSVGLTGVPTAPTAAPGTNTSQIASTSFVQAALSGTVTSFNTRSGAVTLQGADITSAGGALLAGPAFTGAPTAPTQPAGTNNTTLATTAFVASAILANTAAVTSFNGRTGAVTLTTADITAAGGAPIASPAFSGVPTAATATAGTSTTQLATTQFVQAAIASSGVASFNGRTGAVTLIANDVSAAGGALIASPTFTGTPAGPTAAPGTNTTQLASTAFVTAALGAYAPLASPAFTGTPTAPVPAGNNDSAQIATTSFVQTGLTSVNTTIANQFLPQSVTNPGYMMLNNRLLIQFGTNATSATGNVSVTFPHAFTTVLIAFVVTLNTTGPALVTYQSGSNTGAFVQTWDIGGGAAGPVGFNWIAIGT